MRLGAPRDSTSSRSSRQTKLSVYLGDKLIHEQVLPPGERADEGEAEIVLDAQFQFLLEPVMK